MTWSARQYTAFEKERTRPVRDLVAALPQEQIRHAVDLGCGPGNSTEVLAERYPDARISGLDSSEDMIEAARQRLPGLTFSLADIARWAPSEPLDIILANASLQWLPDHDQLYPRLIDCLKPGGSLAIQTPDNLQEPAHRMARELAAQGPWASRTASVQHPPRHSAEHYYDILRPHCRHVDLWRTTYYHPLEGGAQAVVEWFKGSALRPYLDVLETPQQAAFLKAYHQAMEQAYPVSGDGKVLLPFPRLFIVATR
jgi:trans-aconitate 2-methyltransferase